MMQTNESGTSESGVASSEQLTIYSLKPILLISTLWFSKSGALDDGKFLSLADNLMLALQTTLKSRTGMLETNQVYRSNSSGYTTLFSDNGLTSISLSNRFVEMRCSETSIPDAKDIFVSLSDVLFSTIPNPTSGVTLEIQGIVEEITKSLSSVPMIMGKLLSEDFRQSLIRLMEKPDTNCSIRLFLERKNVPYTIDVGPDLRNPLNLFVRLRSKRPDHTGADSFKNAWDEDIELWSARARPLLDMILKGGV